MYIYSIPNDIIINILTFISWYDIYSIIENICLIIEQVPYYRDILHNIYIEKKKAANTDREIRQNATELSNFISCIASRGYIEIIKCMREYNMWHYEIYTAAVKNGQLECLKYEYEIQYIQNKTLCRDAAENGHLNCLKYVHQMGCPWDHLTCKLAAENGHLDCLQYAHENGCPWDVNTCTSAARNGHLNCLQYAHENGCPWNEWTCNAAVKNGHLECLKYAHENGCPWDEYTCYFAAENEHIDCLQYVYENGCPWSSCDFKTQGLGHIKHNHKNRL